MKKHVFLVPLLALAIMQCGVALAQSKVDDNCTLQSKILNSERKFSIYLPDGYDQNSRSYPVLYLLHGSGDDHTGWVQFGEVQRIADKAISNGSASAMIIVMPDANSVQKGYFNSADGKFNYEDFFITELIPHIEKTYRCRAEKQYRAVAGLSMGGGGSLIYALHYPEMFSSCSPLSAAIYTDNKAIMQNYDTKNVSEKVLSDWCNKYDVIKLVNEMPDNVKKSVRWFIDIGDDDFLYEGNSMLHIAMRNKNIPHEFRMRDGGHSWGYWREALPDVLSFASQTFRR